MKCQDCMSFLIHVASELSPNANASLQPCSWMFPRGAHKKTGSKKSFLAKLQGHFDCCVQYRVLSWRWCLGLPVVLVVCQAYEEYSYFVQGFSTRINVDLYVLCQKLWRGSCPKYSDVQILPQKIQIFWNGYKEGSIGGRRNPFGWLVWVGLMERNRS